MDRAEALAFIQYLDDKRSVDDRALNQNVLAALKAHLQGLSTQRDFKVLEVGAGIGSMLARLLDLDVIRTGRYDAIEINAALVGEAHSRLARYAERRSLSIESAETGVMIIRSNQHDLQVDFSIADILDFIRDGRAVASYDLLIAHAVLDLLDLHTVLPGLLQTLNPGGIFYFTLNFDGITHFEPPIDPQFDRAISSLYHDTMDQRTVAGHPSGDHQTGRKLLGMLLAQGASILAAGASDWLVLPVEGAYPDQEARFLAFILDTIEAALAGSESLDNDQLSAWLSTRRRQLERIELVYLAHQIDVLGRWPG